MDYLFASINGILSACFGAYMMDLAFRKKSSKPVIIITIILIIVALFCQRSESLIIRPFTLFICGPIFIAIKEFFN